MYLTALGPPPALIQGIFASPLADLVIAVPEVIRIGFDPSLLSLPLALGLAAFAPAALLTIANTDIRAKESSTERTSGLLYHAGILEENRMPRNRCLSPNEKSARLLSATKGGKKNERNKISFQEEMKNKNENKTLGLPIILSGSVLIFPYSFDRTTALFAE